MIYKIILVILLIIVGIVIFKNRNEKGLWLNVGLFAIIIVSSIKTLLN